LGADRKLSFERQLQTPHVRTSDQSGMRPLRVGLAWAGNPRYKADRQRSTKLDTLIPLLRTPGINWISLQKGPGADQLAGLAGRVFVWDGASRDVDLAETAALLATV